jgi:hypothetical protein
MVVFPLQEELMNSPATGVAQYPLSYDGGEPVYTVSSVGIL